MAICRKRGAVRYWVAGLAIIAGPNIGKEAGMIQMVADFLLTSIALYAIAVAGSCLLLFLGYIHIKVTGDD